MLRITRTVFSSKSRFSLVTRNTSSYQWSYVSGTTEEPLTGLTLGQLIDASADKYGNREALISMHQKSRKTFLEVKKDAEQLGAGLINLGLQKGDRLGIWGPNSYQWYQTQMAAAKAGLVLVNVNPGYKSSELKYCINKVGIKAMISAESFRATDYFKVFSELNSEDIPSLEHFIMMSGAKGKTLKFCDVLHSGLHEDYRTLTSMENVIQMDDPVNIQFTSGTTGNPKGACLSHHNIVNNAKFLGLRLGYHLKPHKIAFPAPLYHTFGCVMANICAMHHGATVVLTGPHFNAKDTLIAIDQEKCNSVYGTPTMFTDMIETLKSYPIDTTCLETGIMAGAPCPEKLCQDVIKYLNADKFTIAYGMTETSPVSFQGFPEDSIELKTTTIGYPVPHVEVKVVDEQGRIVPVGTPGELCTRGYNVMLGYWNDEDKTSELIGKDGWLRSGDLGIIHANGYGQVVGRIKDMVIRGGENLFPREIEELLGHHPAVAEAYVIGVPDPRFGEELCAWIKLHSDCSSDLSEGQIKDFCKESLAHFKVPKYILFVDEFPQTVTGKIQKYKMREQSIEFLELNKH